ncbi:MAG: CotH kinase family protein [Calditrichia bacterium]
MLRGGNNRSWARKWNPEETTYTEDQWFRDTQIAMTGYGAHGNFVHLYINGIYWGLYNPVERPDQFFSSEYLAVMRKIKVRHESRRHHLW